LSPVLLGFSLPPLHMPTHQRHDHDTQNVAVPDQRNGPYHQVAIEIMVDMGTMHMHAWLMWLRLVTVISDIIMVMFGGDNGIRPDVEEIEDAHHDDAILLLRC
jgi:hypothetical protein